jgi:hypothetical protein
MTHANNHTHIIAHCRNQFIVYIYSLYIYYSFIVYIYIYIKQSTLADVYVTMFTLLHIYPMHAHPLFSPGRWQCDRSLVITLRTPLSLSQPARGAPTANATMASNTAHRDVVVFTCPAERR